MYKEGDLHHAYISKGLEISFCFFPFSQFHYTDEREG